MTATLFQMDMFNTAPAPPPRMAASVPAATRRRTCPIVIGGLPPGATADIEIMVHDGIKHSTYLIQ
jgi:hypothetical protein